MDQQRAPIYEKLQEYMRISPTSFHIPGHKRRSYLANRMGLLKEWFLSDVTEITGMDDLHAPEAIIREAEDLAATCFGADQTFLLVGGSTSGNLALLLSICHPGDIVLVDRHAHKSVLHGLMLARAQAVFLSVELNERSGVPVGISSDTVAAAIKRYPDARAVMLTCPNYYGWGPNIEEIVSQLDGSSIPLIIDEAHGVHYGFHEDLPQSALQRGADAVVQSAHKMGGGLTMGAFLHLRGDRIDPYKVRQALAMVQSSSPSYPILASLDVFRSTWATDGARLIQQGLDVVRAFREYMQDLPRFIVADTYANNQLQAEHEHRHRVDPFKVYMYDRTEELDGYALQQQLEQRQCMIEMADPRGVLLVFTYASTMEDARQLYAACEEIAKETVRTTDDKANTTEANPERSIQSHDKPTTIEDETRVSEPLDLANWHDIQPTEAIRLEQAMGRKLAETIIPYPPGVPLIWKGELLTEQCWMQLLQLRNAGARFQGTEDVRLTTVRVIIDGN